MIIIKYREGLDKNVFLDIEITEGAKALYGYINGLEKGALFNEKYIINKLRINRRTYLNRRKELIKHGYIYIKKINERMPIMFIGDTKISGKDYWHIWENNNDK